MSRDISENLAARKWPVVVYYGPQRVTREGASSLRVTFEADPGADVVTPSAGLQRNPRRVYVRMLGVRIVLQAASCVNGARLCEHVELCDRLVDAVLVELSRWTHDGSHIPVALISTGYVRPEDFSGAEKATAGVVYEIRCRIPRAVEDRDYEGNAADEAGWSSASNTIRVSTGGDFEEVS